MTAVTVQPVCAQWGCTRPREKRLWCERCYREWLREEREFVIPWTRGTIAALQRAQFTCAWPDCKKQPRRREWCLKHYKTLHERKRRERARLAQACLPAGQQRA